jgi:putative SbcD/Mre11-related phosphoesterase
MDPTPIHGEPALFAPDISTLFITDLHIGIEHEMFLAGAKIPGKTRELQARLVKLLKETKAKTLVIAGDLKHNIPVSSFLEEREIPRFIDALFELVDEIHLTPGNHDGGISDFLPRGVKLHSNKGFVLGNYGIWHGHCWPLEEVMACRTVLMGHVHPQAAFVDGVETRHAERCWVRGGWNFAEAHKRYATLGEGFLMIPAFNDLCGGSHVNDMGQRKIGIVLRHELADVRMAEMFLMDGTHLGKIQDNLVKVGHRFNRR